MVILWIASVLPLSLHWFISGKIQDKRVLYKNSTIQTIVLSRRPDVTISGEDVTIVRIVMFFLALETMSCVFFPV